MARRDGLHHTREGVRGTRDNAGGNRAAAVPSAPTAVSRALTRRPRVDDASRLVCADRVRRRRRCFETAREGSGAPADGLGALRLELESRRPSHGVQGLAARVRRLVDRARAGGAAARRRRERAARADRVALARHEEVRLARGAAVAALQARDRGARRGVAARAARARRARRRRRARGSDPELRRRDGDRFGLEEEVEHGRLRFPRAALRAAAQGGGRRGAAQVRLRVVRAAWLLRHHRRPRGARDVPREVPGAHPLRRAAAAPLPRRARALARTLDVARPLARRESIRRSCSAIRRRR